MEKVSLALLEAVHRNMAGRVRYGMGCKAPALDCDSHEITRIDCSGYVRYVLARATSQRLILPDGSWEQRAWCETRLRQLARYADVAYAKEDPSRLFIAFIEPGAIGPGKAGHVWLVLAGRTLESYGGVGVGSRPWDAWTLKRYASAAYELPVAP